MTREERWREAVDAYFAPAGMALADAEVAAAVAAVRADLAREIEAAPLAYDEPWSACEPYVLAIVKGPSS